MRRLFSLLNDFNGSWELLKSRREYELDFIGPNVHEIVSYNIANYLFGEYRQFFKKDLGSLDDDS